MSCESYRQLLLDLGLDEAARKRTAAILAHGETCPECREAARDLDRVRAALQTFQTDAEPTGGWAAFEQRLAANPPRPITPRWSWRAPLMGIAASLLIAGVSFQLGRMLTTGHPEPVAVAMPGPAFPESNAFAPAQLNHEVKAFDQVSKVFDGHASWMLVSNDASDVGIASHPVSATARHVLLLRLTVTRGGQIASDADVLVIPGQTANLNVPLSEGNSLHYRIGTSTGEPTRLGILLELNTSHGGEPLAALSTQLQMQPGQKLTAGQLATSAGDYELKIGFARADLPEGAS